MVKHGGSGELEPVLFENPGGLVVVGAGAPQQRLGDRPIVERRGAQQVGDQLLAGGVKERVGSRVGVAVGAHERVGQLQRPAVGGHVGERVPPPGRLAAREPLGIEVPHLPEVFAQQAGGGVQVGFVGGRKRGAGSGEQRGDRPGAGFAAPWTPDVALHVLPGGIQRLAAADRSRDRQTFLLDAEALGGSARVGA